MGCCFSSETGINNSVTDGQVNYEQMMSMQKNSIKLLLLGTSGCGKTTITKQLQKINNVYQRNCHSIDNVLMIIHNTIINDIKTLCQYKQNSVNRNSNITDLIEAIIELHPPYIVTPHIAHLIKTLCNDISIRETLQQRHTHRLNISDNIEYFLNKIDEISVQQYSPTFEDSVRVHSQTNGYSNSTFVKNIDTFGKFMFAISDIGGARSERRKWWHPKLLLDPELNTIIYVVAISDYNMVSFDDTKLDALTDKTNNLIDSINTFQEMIGLMNEMNETFANKCIILLFNKFDLFIEKIKTIPITVAPFDNIPNDMNPNDCDDVIRFIAIQFLNVFKEYEVTLKHPLQIIRTSAIDTNSIKEMFDTVSSQIIVNSMNFQSESEELFKSQSEMDGFAEPLISAAKLPKMTHQYSTPTHNNQLPTLKDRTHAQSLPIFANVNEKQIVLRDI